MSEPSSSWGREFDELIALPDGRKLVAMRDAASYITALPRKEADTPEWQAAIEALMLVLDVRPDRCHAGLEPLRDEISPQPLFPALSIPSR
jgi:hypothetical protein